MKNKLFLFILFLTVGCFGTQQSSLDGFKKYQQENPSCNYYAAAIMDKGVDHYGWAGVGYADFACGDSIEEAKKNALRECEWDADGLLNKAIEVGTLFLIDFPCKVLFTEKNSNQAYINEGPRKECTKLGYKQGTDKYKKCLDTLSN